MAQAAFARQERYSFVFVFLGEFAPVSIIGLIAPAVDGIELGKRRARVAVAIVGLERADLFLEVHAPQSVFIVVLDQRQQSGGKSSAAHIAVA